MTTVTILLLFLVSLQFSPLITSHTRGIFCMGHAWLWCLPCRIAAWATPAFRREPVAWHVPLTATRGHSTFIIKPMFLALLYMYDLMHCIHVHLTYSFCHSHTGWLWLRTFRTGDWLQWRKISASNTCTHTILLCYHALNSILTWISPLLKWKNSPKIKTLDMWSTAVYRLIRRQIMWPWFQLLKVKCSKECGFYFSTLVPFSSSNSGGFLYYRYTSPWKLAFNAYLL